MHIKNQIMSLIFKIVLAVLCTIGLILNSGLAEGEFSLMMFVYYTILSNLVVLIFFIYAIAKVIGNMRAHGFRQSVSIAPAVKGGVTMMITVTMLVYHFLLVPALFTMETSDAQNHFYNLGNILVHYLTPILVIVDWLLFDKKNQFRWYYPLTWLSIPLTYLVFVLIRAQLGGPLAPDGTMYPYFFVNVDLLGWGGALIWWGILLVAFSAIGYIIYLIDKFNYADGLFRFGTKRIM